MQITAQREEKARLRAEMETEFLAKLDAIDAAEERREEMWERLGMNWRKGTCLPNPKYPWGKTSFKL